MPEQPQTTPITLVEPVPAPPGFTIDLHGLLADLARQGYTNTFDARSEPSKAEKLDQHIHADVALEDAGKWYAELAELMPPCQTVSMAGRRRTEDAPDEDLSFRMFTLAEIAAGMSLPDFPSPECSKWTVANRPTPWPSTDGSDG